MKTKDEYREDAEEKLTQGFAITCSIAVIQLLLVLVALFCLVYNVKGSPALIPCVILIFTQEKIVYLFQKSRRKKLSEEEIMHYADYLEAKDKRKAEAKAQKISRKYQVLDQ